MFPRGGRVLQRLNVATVPQLAGKSFSGLGLKPRSDGSGARCDAAVSIQNLAKFNSQNEGM